MRVTGEGSAVRVRFPPIVCDDWPSSSRTQTALLSSHTPAAFSVRLSPPCHALSFLPPRTAPLSSIAPITKDTIIHGGPLYVESTLNMSSLCGHFSLRAPSAPSLYFITYFGLLLFGFSNFNKVRENTQMTLLSRRIIDELNYVLISALCQQGASRTRRCGAESPLRWSLGSAEGTGYTRGQCVG